MKKEDNENNYKIERVWKEIICNCCTGDKSCKLCGGTGRRVEYHYIFVDKNGNAIDGDTLK